MRTIIGLATALFTINGALASGVSTYCITTEEKPILVSIYAADGQVRLRAGAGAWQPATSKVTEVNGLTIVAAESKNDVGTIRVTFTSAGGPSDVSLAFRNRPAKSFRAVCASYVD